MKNLFSALVLFFLIFLCSCNNGNAVNAVKKEDSAIVLKNNVPESKSAANVAEIMSRKQIPILCYHHIHEQVNGKKIGDYQVTPSEFNAQIKTLADSGYHTILPDQLNNYLINGTPLPEKPVMLTYDDTDEEQFSIAKPAMDQYGFKGVYFIMTISIGRPRYMNKEQIKQLSDEGHVIASHTWDHHRVDRLTDADWAIQFDKPIKQLEEITGKPIKYFAYPFGVWNQASIPQIKKYGYKLAFQLSTKRDSLQPLYTVRRIIVAPQWSPQGVLKVMKSSFK